MKPNHLVSTCTLVEDRGKKKQTYMALRRYCQDLVHPIRPVYPGGGEVPKDPDRRAEKLLELRGRLTDVLPQAKQAAEQYEKADDRMIAVARARSCAQPGNVSTRRNWSSRAATKANYRRRLPRRRRTSGPRRWC